MAIQDTKTSSPAAGGGEPVRVWKNNSEAMMAVQPGQPYLDADGTRRIRPVPPKPVVTRARTIGVPSQYFQFTPALEDVISLAKAAGFDAIEWSVRDGGHVRPANVKVDLARAVDLTRKAGLKVESIATDIQDARTPHAEDILKAMRTAGLTHYRAANSFKYDLSRDDIYAQLDGVKSRMQSLATLNAKYGARVGYHANIRYDDIGGTTFDFWRVMKDIDPRWVGITYDTGRATSRAGYEAWRDGASIARRWINALAISDFVWKRAPGSNNDGYANIELEMKPVGDGMVDLRHMLEFFGRGDFQGPINIQFEHRGVPEGAVGAARLDIGREAFVSLLKTDLDYVRAVMIECKFAPAP